MNCRQLSRLADSQETASIKEARKLLVEKASMTDEQADKWVRGDLRAAFPILRDKKAAKFILGVTRLFVEQQLNDADAQNKLTRVLKEINEAHYEEFDRNLNSESLQDLYTLFEQSFKEADKATREASSSKQFGKSDYKIYGPYDSFKQAKKAWGNKSQDWCVFHREDMYDNYTSAGQRFYVAAQNGWEFVSKKAGATTPKDEYGNSLIAVSVDIEGNLATSTPRWNHANGGGDNTYSMDELEGIIQMPFYDTFKPYTTKERRERGIVSFEEAAERLASGEDPHGVFDSVLSPQEGFTLVKLNGMWNFIDIEGKFLSDRWFNCAGNFHEGFARVLLNNKFNFIDTAGSFLFDQWFDEAESFREGFARVELNGKNNFVDSKGSFLSDQWFDRAHSFSEGFACVQLNGKWNFIDIEGSFLSDQWFEHVYDFYKGFAEVKLNGDWRRIDKSGKIVDSQRMYNLNCKKLLKLSDSQETASIKKAAKRLALGEDPHDIFDYIGDFNEGFARVMLKDKWNFIDTKGNFLSDQWFDDAYQFSEGFAIVSLNYTKYNFIDTKGNFLSDQWFDFAWHFRDGFAVVFLNCKRNFMDTKGNLLSDQWFDDADYFRDGFACVRLNGKYNFMDTKGSLLSNQWFDYVNVFREGFAYVQLNNKSNFIDTKGNLLSDQWFNDVGLFREGFAAVRVNREWNYIDTEGNILSDQWFDYAMPFKEGFAEVRLNGERHHIDKSGKIVDSQRMYNLNCKKLLK